MLTSTTSSTLQHTTALTCSSMADGGTAGHHRVKITGLDEKEDSRGLLAQTPQLPTYTHRDAMEQLAPAAHQVECEVCLLGHLPEPLQFAFLSHVGKLQSNADCHTQQQHNQALAAGCCTEPSLEVFRCHTAGVVCSNKQRCVSTGWQRGISLGGFLLPQTDGRHPTWDCAYMHRHFHSSCVAAGAAAVTLLLLLPFALLLLVGRGRARR
jgi:hypothetical protein